MNKLAVVILAAGEAKRFGGAKQLADIDGKPMLQWIIDSCCQISEIDLFVTLGARVEDILCCVDLKQSNLLVAVEWAEGIGSTIRSAVEQLQDQYDGILFLAGDQPLVTHRQLEPMIEYWRANPDTLCCSSYDSTLGVPAIYPRRLFAELLTLSGDQGAKQLLLAEQDHLESFVMPSAAVDIDRPEDLELVTDMAPKD